jgi:isocitrate dehydrogenase (NAD+)
MSLRITLIQGGGIGHDTVPAVLRIIEAAGIEVNWERHVAGGEAIAQGLEPLPREMLESVRRTGLALKTHLLPLPGDSTHNYNVLLRRVLGVFASVRPLKNLRGLPARFSGVDMFVIRELTEDLYASIEHEIAPGVVQSIKVVTEAASRRFFRFTFEWARATGRKTVHCVHKANILKLADGLFLESFRTVAHDFPELRAKEIIVDNCCMQMVSRPQQFDVLAMGNLYGDIVSDLGAGIVGGTSAAAGINIGAGLKVFDCFHAPDRAVVGADRANPLPLLLPALDLLESVGHKDAGQKILRAVEDVLSAGKTVPSDLGGQATTSALADAIILAMRING